MLKERLLKNQIIITLLFIPGLVSAMGSFSLTPAKVEVLIKPGETVTREIKINNNFGRESYFSVGVQDITSSGDDRSPVSLLGNDLGPYSLKNYITPQVSDFKLRNGESKIVQVKISIPKNAPPAGLYGAVTVSTYTSSSTDSNARIISGLGSLFFVRVDGPVRETGSLSDFRLRPGLIVLGDKKPVFEVIFRNEGNIYLNPYGFIGIKKWGRQLSEKIDIKPWFVLPESNRLREIVASSTLPSGIYRADLFENRGYNNIIDNKSIWFIKLSIQAALGLILGLIIVIGSVIYVLRKIFQ